MILLGGTFDPVHEGHLQWAERIRVAAGVDEIYLLPCATPVHRAAPGATGEQRVAMLHLACAGRVGLIVDDCEIHRDSASYTVTTLREKRAQRTDEKLFWVVGQDSFNALLTWREPTAILQLATLIVMAREGCDVAREPYLALMWQQRQALTPETLASARAGDVLWVQGATIPYSATAIRAAIQSGDPTPSGVTASVARYIQQHNLYT